MKTALIFGITGQTGSYLAELLLDKGINVVGFVRRSSISNTKRIDKIKDYLVIEDGDITDAHSVNSVFEKYKPDYCFNLAAQSFVGTSFNQPSLTFDVNTRGVLNILEAIKAISPQTKFLQCSTSEMFGSNYDKMHGPMTGVWYQDENTEFRPESPYAISKVSAHQLCQLYRKAYGLFICCAISFNHESPRRGDEFVTKKIINYVKEWHNRGFGPLKLGNIHASRDWSHAKDMANGYVLALNHPVADDYVFSSQVTHTVEQFLEKAFSQYGLNWKDSVEIDETLKRPSEVEYLLGISEKARRVLGWKPEYDLDALIADMFDGE